VSLLNESVDRMGDYENVASPPNLEAILEDTRRLGFGMACEPATGSLLRTLANAKPGGRFLELGTGTGVSACWILAGMDKQSSLTSVELAAQHNQIAKKHLGHDPRVEFVTADGNDFLAALSPEKFDFVFADAWPGKFSKLEFALKALRQGGFYIVDDMLPQVNWPEGHTRKVVKLITALESRDDLLTAKLNWASGLIICTKL
jgi:predicted O-methyltransferase YrrM